MAIMLPGFDAEAFLRDTLGAQNITRRGAEINHSCVLPFGHTDNHPSASFNEDKLVYVCSTCATGGNIVWLVQTVLNVSSKEARNLLGAQIDPGNITRDKFLQMLDKVFTENEEQQIAPVYSDALLVAWERPTAYLASRGVSVDIQRQMRTGINLYNQDHIDGKYITQPRIVIPHFVNQELRGWTMRKLDDRQLGGKWTHSPSFPVGNTLFNWDAIDPARGHDPNREFLLVESPLSVLRLIQHGYLAVATFGAAVGKRQLELLEPFQTITIFPDGDQPGYRAYAKLADLLPTKAVYVLDHGRSGELKEDGWNHKDAADYTKKEIESMEKIPAVFWKVIE